jgi:predicted Zn-dependent protease with MMP-like domain
MRIARTTFERLVREENNRVLKSLSPDLRAMAEKVTIVIADRPSPRERDGDSGDDLLGLYEGISLTDRHVDDMEAVADQITLFRFPLMDLCDTAKELRKEIRITIIHELGHYFGFEEGELEERGL